MDNLVKKQSLIQGTGIFVAQKPIKQGEVFYQIPNDNIRTRNHPKASKIGKGKYIWDEEVLNYVNHSCDPNAKLDLKKPALVALRDIAVGEEITNDYNATEDSSYRFVCRCGSPKCRGVMGALY